MNKQGKKRVLLGLSGGVDSALSALLLKEQGFELNAVRMGVYNGPEHAGINGGCYGRNAAEDVEAAARLAAQLNIPFRVIDCAEPYEKLVMNYFKGEYLAGRTPNPCIRCNETVKFGALLTLARQSGLEFDYFATGHYARLEHSPEFGCTVLRRGADPVKDQSYFLYRLKPELLNNLIFPLGGYSKTETRRLAAERGLVVHDRPDSQDFYGGEYADLLEMPCREGNIVDSSGKVLGRHKGFWHYTPGQRRGLGVPAAHPLYVLKILPACNEVVVGPAEENLFEGCLIENVNFLLPSPEDGSRLLAKMRSFQKPHPVLINRGSEEDTMRITFEKPMSGLAPGQSLVLYKDDIVVGGGIIRA